MKHLIETANPSGLAITEYDRIILNSATNDVIVRGGANANGHTYVDLGLPSGLKWATMNVGATSETDYGYYFQWGDIVDKSNSDCRWATYKHCNGSGTTLTKYSNKSSYGTMDNITTLESVDDAAAQIMGGDWRMPTQTEFQELIEGTTNEWITNYEGTGVNGMKFTHKTDTSKYIFIPAAGTRSGSSSDSQGRYGYVWSSSLFTDPDSARLLTFYSGYVGAKGFTLRYNGQVVRGVL